MTESSRIEDLRRRVQADPASIAFAQLAEEYRRAGHLPEAVATCQTGLAVHPGYTAARVTLGRALLQLERLDEADAAFRHVLETDPENVPALRGLGDLSRRQGALAEAMDYYKAALLRDPHDPGLQRAIDDLSAPLIESLSAAARSLALRQIAALEQWMTAVHVARSHRRA
jgi:tetratricopeptide (TPR) repeat protein